MQIFKNSLQIEPRNCRKTNFFTVLVNRNFSTRKIKKFLAIPSPRSLDNIFPKHRKQQNKKNPRVQVSETIIIKNI